MPLARLIALILGILVILGMVIWLIDSLTRLSGMLAMVPPWLATVLVGLLVALVLVLVAIFCYYFFILPRQESKRVRRRVAPKAPVEKTEAATENINAVRQQVEQLQDEVARQALISRSREIEASLARGELVIALFGTGSSGKTSLVNALMGRIVGEVGATMGTTDMGASYRMKIKGVDREILITDTPGILEAGNAGGERENRARKLAADANLLLFVLDSDLRQSEFKPLTELIAIGKRSIVVLNKIDRLTEDDLEAIMGNLRSKLKGYVGPTDIVAISASPQAIRLNTGEVVTPDPDILPLIRHMAAVVRAEGDDLLADNILLQSQRLGDETRQLIDSQRRRQAEKTVDRFKWIGAGAVAVTPLPVIDLLATAAVNAQMVVEIGKIYGCDITPDRGREMAISLGKTLASLGIVKGVVTLVTTFLQVSVAGLIAGRAIQAVSAAYLTHIAGRSFIEYFRQDQNWGDGGMGEVVQRQFELNRRDEFVKAFVKDAFDRVVKPLQMEAQLEGSEDPGLPPAKGTKRPYR
jgi:uncharacterized protein